MSRFPLFAPVASRFLPLQRILLPLLMLGLVLVSLVALARTVMKTYEPESGAWDLHPYWYFGHFVHAGINPYAAYAEKLTLPGPAHYLDGSVVAPEAVAQPKLGLVPANTAPVLLLLSLLSFFPWLIAKSIWLVCNVALIVAIPWLAMRLLPPSLLLARPLQWLAAFSFYAMKGPREAAASGQTSLLVFFLMIVTLLLRQSHWLWAGLALGVALGKYSLSLPVFLFLLLEKRFRLLAVAILVQVVGLGVVSALGDGSVGETLRVYWSMISRHSVQPGVHLGYALHSYPLFMNVLVVAGSVVTLTMVGYRRWQGWLAADVLPVNSVLVMWVLLAAYHRNYDALMVILFLILCLAAAATWQLPPGQALMLGIVWLLSLIVMCLPGDLIRVIATDEQAALFLIWVDRAMTVAIAMMWAVNLWLLLRTPRVNE
jgi:hypothetical protein